MAHNEKVADEDSMAYLRQRETGVYPEGFNELAAAAAECTKGLPPQHRGPTLALLAVAERLRIANLIALRQVDYDEETSGWFRQIGRQVKVQRSSDRIG